MDAPATNPYAQFIDGLDEIFNATQKLRTQAFRVHEQFHAPFEQVLPLLAAISEHLDLATHLTIAAAYSAEALDWVEKKDNPS